MITRVVNRVDVVQSPRVKQASGLFDVPPIEKSERIFDVHLPIEQRDWNVGLIVGPSGSGKSSIARALFDDALVRDVEWPDDRSVLDAFPASLSIKEITALLTSVGFGSPPSWLRPFRALSNGEQFRVSMARALAEHDELCVVDEFTSVVDRQVAQVASHTVQKAVRARGSRFIAVTCHYDVIDWLQPDWVYQPQADDFAWRSPQRHPPIELRVARVDRSAWRHFAHFHYLSADLSTGAQCFGAFLADGQCVAFTSYVHFPHPRVDDIKMGHRLVVLPDWQGLGIAGRLDDWLGEYLHARGFRYHNSVVSPAMIAHYSRSPRWKLISQGIPPRSKSTNSTLRNRHNKLSATRAIASFAYVPQRKDDA